MDSKSSNSSSSDHLSSRYIESPAGRIKTYDDEFMMYEFKVFPCSIIERHDWLKCRFYHSGETKKRRDPRKYDYSPLQCPKFRNEASCEKGDSCEFAHGLFESWLHPGQYHSRLCKDGKHCGRDVCFFAHDVQELRPIYEDTGCAERRYPFQLSSTAAPFYPTQSGFLASQETPFTVWRRNGTDERNVGITTRDLILRPDLIPNDPRLEGEVSSSWTQKAQATAETESHLSRLNTYYASDFSNFLNQYAQDSMLNQISHSHPQAPSPVGQPQPRSLLNQNPQPQLLLNPSSKARTASLMNQSSEPRSSSLMNRRSHSHAPSPSILNQSSRSPSPLLMNQSSQPPSPQATNPNAATKSIIFSTFLPFQRSNQENNLSSLLLNQSSKPPQPSSLLHQSPQPQSPSPLPHISQPPSPQAPANNAASTKMIFGTFLQ